MVVRVLVESALSRMALNDGSNFITRVINKFSFNNGIKIETQQKSIKKFNEQMTVVMRNHQPYSTDSRL